MGMESGSGLSVADALALQNRDNDGMFGGGSGTWVWVFFLFFLLELPSVDIANEIGVLAVALGIAVVTAGISGVITLRNLNFRTERTDDIDGLGVLNGSNELPVIHMGRTRYINQDELGSVYQASFLILDLFEGLTQLFVRELTAILNALLLNVGQLLLQTGHIVLKNLIHHCDVLLVL